MKNQLENWEVGLGDRMKGEEFAYDPRAFADFEALYAAEAAGGQAAPPDAVNPAAGASPGGIVVGAKTLLLGGLLLVLGGLLAVYLGQSASATEVARPVLGVELNGAEPVPPSSPALSDYTPTEGTATQPSAAAPQFLADKDGRVRTAKDPDANRLPGPELGALASEALVTKESPPGTSLRPSTRPTRAVASISPLPLKPIAVPKITYPVPSVSPSGNTPPANNRKRDRRTLFPDVIDH